MHNLDSNQCDLLHTQLRVISVALSVTQHVKRKADGSSSQDVLVDDWPAWSAIVIRTTGPESKLAVTEIPPMTENMVIVFSTNDEALDNLLREAGLSWKNQMRFQAAPSTVISVIQNLAEENQGLLQLTSDTKTFFVEEGALDTCELPPLPEGFSPGALEISDAVTVNHNIKGRYGEPNQERLDLIKYLISTFPSVCIRDAKGKLVAYQLVKFHGDSGMLYVEECHRKKGLARYLIVRFAEELQQRNIPVFVYIEKDNEVSLSLYGKCGFIENEYGHITAKYFPADK